MMLRSQIRSSVVYDILLWIDKNETETINTETASLKSGYTKWHFQRLFKRQTGIPLGHYIRLKRLSKAAVDLKSSRHSILDISVKYRFSSQQVFSRAFKNQFGVSPTRYRLN